jgi:hypothetical protein
MSQTSVARARSGLPLKIKEWRAKVHMRAAHSHYQKFIISLPKCGRTWHRIMVGYYLTQIAGMEASRSLDLDALCAQVGLGLANYSHNNTCYINRFPVNSPVFASEMEWHDRDVLLLVRNPRDVLVSAYHHARYRYGRFDGTLGEFIRGENTGILKVLSAYNTWYSRRECARSFSALSYEQMHANPQQILRDTLAFIGLSEIDESLLSAAVSFASPENMRRYENSGYFGAHKSMRRTGDDPRASKIRTAMVGASRDQLTTEDLDYIDAMIRSLGDPFADMYSPNLTG